tara:strand:- start:69 stop:419 length:351 start_codon:yes stop_codon:yes gene_type:complete
MNDFQKLRVWQEAHELVLATYRVTGGLPPEERYGLQSQLRRAAASIPTNIAEGAGRSGPKDYARFLSIAAGSCSEVHYLLILTRDLGFIPPETTDSLISKTVSIRKMLFRLRQKLN